jgi:DNA-binding NtrC family response regulator
MLQVMIVDDERDFAATLAERLKMRGFATRYVTDAAAALVAIEEQRPALVVLDVQMPEVDGLALLSMIKQRDPDIEVILLTGYASVTSGIEGMQRGAFDYLVKPVDLSQLVQKIREAVAGSDSDAA